MRKNSYFVDAFNYIVQISTHLLKIYDHYNFILAGEILKNCVSKNIKEVIIFLCCYEAEKCCKK